MTDPAHAAYISGEHYEAQYREGQYRDIYIVEKFPEWAAQTNRYYAGLLAAYIGLPLHARILDLGSGVGRYIEAWKEIGYQDVTGLEISREAIKHAQGAPNIVQGTVAAMPFDDDEFDLVFSAALLEHIAPEIEQATIDECHRVGRSQAHLIAITEGNDPGHINMKTMEEWGSVFMAARPDTISVLMPDPLLAEYQTLINVPRSTRYQPLIRAVTKRN